MHRALVTGIAGFAGSHLAEHLIALGDVEVHGILRSPGRPSDAGPSQLPTILYLGDLTERDFVRSVVERAKPDLVFHLAAQASVAAAWADPAGTFLNNVVGQVNLLDALVELAPCARVLVVGSAEEYGLVRPEELPIGEEQPFRPNNPYAVSKIGQDMLGYQYYVSRKLQVVRVRPFNHLGPRQRDEFVAASFARQITEAEAGLRPPVVRVGNLDARRDFTDVRDVVGAYWLATTRGEPGEVYNVASGRSVSIRELLETLLGFSRRPLVVEQDPARLRPSDVPDLVGDASKLRRQTGWEPARMLQETLRDTLDHWRKRIERSAANRQDRRAKPQMDADQSG